MRVAFLAANEGIEQVELTEPWKAVEEAGGQPQLICPNPGRAQAFNHLDKADTFSVDLTTADANPADFDAVVLPGGVANPDQLRLDENAVAFLKEMFSEGKPAAVICHGPWTLVEADLVQGRTLTSWPSLQTDIRNAGGTWIDNASVTDQNLTTSRKPDDIPKFNEATLHLFEESRTRGELRRHTTLSR